MRRLLEVVALAGLAVLWGHTAYALLGPHPLQGRVPTHFDLAGHADGWGDAGVLWLLPVIGTALYGMMTLVSRYPAAFNYPVRVTPANRSALQALALQMILWLKTEVTCLFAWIQSSAIRAATESHGALPPQSISIALVVIFGTIGWHIVAMRRTAASIMPRARF